MSYIVKKDNAIKNSFNEISSQFLSLRLQGIHILKIAFGIAHKK